jgi:hypothetical protein
VHAGCRARPVRPGGAHHHDAVAGQAEGAGRIGLGFGDRLMRRPQGNQLCTGKGAAGSITNDPCDFQGGAPI